LTIDQDSRGKGKGKKDGEWFLQGIFLMASGTTHLGATGTGNSIFLEIPHLTVLREARSVPNRLRP
jgi:hypothetical protein